MPSEEEQLLEGVRVLYLPEPTLYAEACASFEAAGVEVPMFSADPLDRLIRYLREELLPRVNAKKAEFEQFVAERSSAIQAEISHGFGATVAGLQQLQGASLDYVEGMRAEGLAGPKTARLVILLATADALKMVALAGPGDPFAALSFSDWLMIALAWIRLRDDFFGGKS